MFVSRFLRGFKNRKSLAGASSYIRNFSIMNNQIKKLCFLLSVLLVTQVCTAFTSRIAGFVEVEFNESETKAIGNPFESFEAINLITRLAENCEEEDEIHIWVGDTFYTYVLEGNDWRIPETDTEIPSNRISDQLGIGCWLTRKTPGKASMILTGVIPENYVIEAKQNQWQLVYFPIHHEPEIRLNDYEWVRALDGDMIRIFNGSNWVDYKFQNQEWAGASHDVVTISYGDSILYKRGKPSRNSTIEIVAPDFASDNGIPIQEIKNIAADSRGAISVRIEGESSPIKNPDGNPNIDISQIKLLVYDSESTLLRSISLENLDVQQDGSYQGVINLGEGTLGGNVELYLLNKSGGNHTAYLGSVSVESNAFLPVDTTTKVEKKQMEWEDADLDQDSLADPWEALHFGGTEEQAGDQDPDFDNLSNQSEQEMGTSPNQQTLRLYSGWSLIAISTQPEPGQTVLDQIGNKFSQTIWYWKDNEYNELNLNEALQPTYGYWVFCSEPVIHDLPHSELGDGVRTISKGWNMAGMIRGGSFPNQEANEFWSYHAGEYMEADINNLYPMTGFWFFSETEQEVILP